MNEAKKLTIQMSIFFTIIFVVLSTIIIKEKSNIIFLPKIETMINNYIEKNYKELNLNKSKIINENNKYKIKLMDKANKNLYFYINYSNKTITDTYKKDYIEGQSLIKYLNKKIEKTILEKTNNKSKVTINNTYNNFSNQVKEKLLKEESIESLKIYTLEIEITTNWETTTILNEITNKINNLEDNGIFPKNFTIIINDINDITKSVKINNLTKNNDLDLIINDIINNKETSILSENKITYEYLN